MVLLTACPSPGKVKKALEMTEKIAFQKKYEKLFNESVNEQKSDLLFYGAIYYKFGTAISLRLKDSLTDGDWQEDLMHFQRKLRQTKTKYGVIDIYDRGTYIRYVSGNLEVYERAAKLFQRNLAQIKQGKIEDLYHTMGETTLKYETIKELLDFVQITQFDDTKLINYPSDEIFRNNQPAFCLKVNANINLYFSYESTKSGLVLRSIDMNSYSY
jgi:hypothetical protein